MDVSRYRNWRDEKLSEEFVKTACLKCGEEHEETVKGI